MSNNPEVPPNLHNNIGIKLGITEPIIEKLVHSFYNKVKEDQLIGPFFNRIIEGRWDSHLSQMCDFWSSIALSTNRYKGQPYLKHMNIPNLNEEHFIRWLSIFEENAYSTCSEEIAHFFVNKAKKIS